MSNDWSFDGKEYVDESTGTIISISRREDKIDDERFVKWRLQSIPSMPDLTQREWRVMYYVLSNMNYDNILIFDVSTREDMIKKTGISDTALSTVISGLRRKELIYKFKRSRIQANPDIFGKGSARHIRGIRIALRRVNDEIVQVTEVARERDNEESVDGMAG